MPLVLLLNPLLLLPAPLSVSQATPLLRLLIPPLLLLALLWVLQLTPPALLPTPLLTLPKLPPALLSASNTDWASARALVGLPESALLKKATFGWLFSLARRFGV